MQKVTFLIQNSASWLSVVTLYNELKEREVEVYIVTIPYIFDITNGSFNYEQTSDNTNKFFDSIKIPYISLRELNCHERVNKLKELNSIIITSIIDDYRFFTALGLTAAEFGSMFEVIYVPYYGSTQVNDVSLHTRTDYYKTYSKIIADSDFYVEMLKSKDVGDDHIINMGHPKIEYFYKSRTKIGKWPIRNSHDKLKIIWAPHWSVPINNFNVKSEEQILENRSKGWQNLLNFGTFVKNYKQFYKYARKNKDRIQIVFKPHHELKHWLYFNYSDKEYEKFYTDWEQLENTHIDIGGDYVELFLGSDILITDGISFLTEYPIVTNKPVIFIDSLEHAPFNMLGLLGEKYSHKVTTFEEIEILLENINNINISDSKNIIDVLLPNRELTSKMIIDRILTSNRP